MSQRSVASSTQPESQVPWPSPSSPQHQGSMVQTLSQHLRLLQLGVPLGRQQLPAARSPHCGSGQGAVLFSSGSLHSGFSRAWLAQVMSQMSSQQNGSSSHTDEQQSSSLQAGVKFGSQQSPAHGSPQSKVQVVQSLGSDRAIEAQTSSQVVSQHTMSSSQTASQHRWSLHAGEKFSSQQFPAAYVPHSGGVHFSRAMLAQVPSQAVVQQISSISQIISQHAASLQPGVGCG